MGVRLYPVFRKQEEGFQIEQEYYDLAKFVGARPVDARIALQFNQVFAKNHGLEIDDRIWTFFHKNFPKAVEIDDLAGDGFGKFNYDAGDAGITYDPDQMTHMLFTLRNPYPFTPEQLDMMIGVSWG